MNRLDLIPASNCGQLMVATRGDPISISPPVDTESLLHKPVDF